METTATKEDSGFPGIHKFSLNATNLGEAPGQIAPLIKVMMRDTGKPETSEYLQLANQFKAMSGEHASRQFLDSFITGLGNDFSILASPQRPELVPDFLLLRTTDVPLTKSTVQEFQQKEKTVPIFGARTFVEIDNIAKFLVSIEANLADKPDVDAVASISPQVALDKICEYCGQTLPLEAQPDSPELVFFPDRKDKKWRLAYHFIKVPLFPPDETHTTGDDPEYCIGESPRHLAPQHDYFVDAHSGEVFYYFSSAPRLDVPVVCDGKDDQSTLRKFNGLNNGGGVLLTDPVRKINTYDFGLQDLSTTTSLPPSPVSNPTAKFASINGPAVSAHYNATLVFDFYNDELKRKGIDDKGMTLDCVVNVYYSQQNPNPSPVWGNAVWYGGKMWYGQNLDPAGKQISFARYLDVIGHELTHGVTETTSALVYRDLSGALNESFSDIFGIFIKNWFPAKPNSLSTWNWQMGPGLGRGGGAIRDFSNPAACGQPDHFRQYVPVTYDSGGVHKYSGIHNFAAYKVLTAKDAAGQYIFTPTEVAILYYLTLTRLTRMSDFSDCRRVLLNVAGVYYGGDPAVAAQKQKAISDAYDAVGIV